MQLSAWVNYIAGITIGLFIGKMLGPPGLAGFFSIGLGLIIGGMVWWGILYSWRVLKRRYILLLTTLMGGIK